MPVRLTHEEFEKLVGQGIDAIPQEFLDMLDNVAVVVADRPTPEQKDKSGLGHGWDLLGLYEGVSHLDRAANYSGVLPDKITIFQRPIEAIAESPEDVAEIVRDTVWHEIAHHFGMDEGEVRAAEERRRNRLKYRKGDGTIKI